jgi:hypothetical protein
MNLKDFVQLTGLPRTARLHKRNRSYEKIMDAVRLANGDWIEVPLGEVRGTSFSNTTHAIRSAAWYCNLDVEVADGTDKLFICLISAAPVEVSHA